MSLDMSRLNVSQERPDSFCDLCEPRLLFVLSRLAPSLANVFEHRCSLSEEADERHERGKRGRDEARGWRIR